MSDITLQSELESTVKYLSNLNNELESVNNVIDSVCIDYICANKALNDTDDKISLLYKRLERWRFQDDQISQILDLHRENEFIKSETIESQFMDSMGFNNETISNDSEYYKNVNRFKRGIIALKLARSFARKANNLSDLIARLISEGDLSNYKQCLSALSTVSKIFKHVISDSAYATSSKMGGESVFANNILRQFLKISIDSTESYSTGYSTCSELALIELIKYIPMNKYINEYKNAVESLRSINYESDESPITFYLFNMSTIYDMLKDRGFINIIPNYIHPNDIHAYYFDNNMTSDILQSIHDIQSKIIQITILDHVLRIINKLIELLSSDYHINVNLSDAIYRVFIALDYMIDYENPITYSIWDGKPYYI